MYNNYDNNNGNNNNNNANNNNNNHNPNNYNGYNGYNGYNEYSFYPENQHNGGQKTGRVVIALLVTFAVIIALGTVSLVALTISSGNSRVSSTQSGGSPSGLAGSNVSEGDDENEVVRTDIPTITQLSTPSDALSIPEIVEKVSPSVVGISCTLYNGTATGTGIIMSEDGYILTNAHVVDGATDISVVLSKELESEQLKAELIGADTQTDIAVLKVDKSGLPAAEFGTSSEMVVGEAAIVIGNPLGFELSGSVTAGIVSALDRELVIEDREMNLIQTDASINSGNSGGPLINSYGQVVGITSAKINTTYGEGLGFAIPIDDAMPIVDDLLKYGYVKGRPLLGISGENVTEIYSQYYGIPQGFIVRSVTEGSAADDAGIRVGDIVIGINGQLITTIEEFNECKAEFKAGDKISVSIYKNDQIIDVDVILGEAR